MQKNDVLTSGQWAKELLAALGTEGDWQPDIERGLARFREQRAAMGRRRRWTWVTGGAVVICLSLTATPVTRAFAQRCLATCVNEASWLRQWVEGGSATPSITYIRGENRRLAPDFGLSDDSGRRVSLSSFRGKVVLLNFWATWCQPCGKEIPWFIEFQRENANHGFQVLGISLDEGGWETVKPYLQQRRVNYPVMIGSADIARLYGGVDSLPATFVIDRQGRIAAVHVGLCSRGEYESDLRAALRE